MPHEHEIEFKDGSIVCHSCGEKFESYNKEIATFPSKKMADSMLHEIAVAGNFTSIGFSDGFVVYSRIRHDGSREEITGRKKRDRSYVIYKKMIAMGEEHL